MFHSLRLCHARLRLARHQLETPSAIGMAWHGLVSCHTASTPMVDVTPQRMRPLGVFTMFPGRRLNKVATMVNDLTDIYAQASTSQVEEMGSWGRGSWERTAVETSSPVPSFKACGWLLQRPCLPILQSHLNSRPSSSAKMPSPSEPSSP